MEFAGLEFENLNIACPYHHFLTISVQLNSEVYQWVTMQSPPWVQSSLVAVESLERFSRAGPRGRGREWATLGVHPLSWLLSNNRLEELCGTLTTGTFSSRLLLSNQDKGCTPSVAHSLPLPLGPALLNLWTVSRGWEATSYQNLTSDSQTYVGVWFWRGLWWQL